MLSEYTTCNYNIYYAYYQRNIYNQHLFLLMCRTPLYITNEFVYVLYDIVNRFRGTLWSTQVGSNIDPRMVIQKGTNVDANVVYLF